MLVAALLPPPTPFKFFVLAAGVFELPLASFTAAIALARVLRYFTVGYLAVRYGSQALPFLAAHKLGVALGVMVFVAVQLWDVAVGLLTGTAGDSRKVTRASAAELAPCADLSRPHKRIIQEFAVGIGLDEDADFVIGVVGGGVAEIADLNFVAFRRFLHGGFRELSDG